jgi:transposase
MDLSALAGGRRRRSTYTRAFKTKAVGACMQPGVSIAAIAMDLRVNANVLRRWVREEERASLVRSTTIEPVTVAASQLVPVSVSPTPSTAVAAADLRITINQGATKVEIVCPPAAEGQCAKLLREWLR